MRFKTEAELAQWVARAKTQPSLKSAVAKQQELKTVDVNVQRRILGVDTALRCTGWGIIDVRGNVMKAVDCGVIKNSAGDKVSECLRVLSGGIRELVTLYHPNSAVLEGAFFFQNVRTAMMLGSARGAVMAVLAENGIDIHEYAPRRVKQSICGFGNASKQQVALLVSQQLNIKIEQVALDATDALAMAICHAMEITTTQGLGVPPEI